MTTSSIHGLMRGSTWRRLRASLSVGMTTLTVGRLLRLRSYSNELTGSGSRVTIASSRRSSRSERGGQPSGGGTNAAARRFSPELRGVVDITLSIGRGARGAHPRNAGGA